MMLVDVVRCGNTTQFHRGFNDPAALADLYPRLEYVAEAHQRASWVRC